MSHEAVQTIIGNAVIDQKFRKGLLGEPRLRLISKFDLTLEETSAIMEINADTLEHFTGQLDQWIQKETGVIAPPQLPPLRFRNRRP